MAQPALLPTPGPTRVSWGRWCWPFPKWYDAKLTRTARRTPGLQSSDPGLNDSHRQLRAESCGLVSLRGGHRLVDVAGRVRDFRLPSSHAAWAVDRDNENDLVEGERYRFDVGEGSFTMRAFLNTIRQAVYVKSFEPVRTR
jgi:hypothetical protein